MMHEYDVGGEEALVVYDHPRPIVCTCGHPFGCHDQESPLFRCKRCCCGIFMTDWDAAYELGFEPMRRVRAPQWWESQFKGRRHGAR